MKNGGFFLGSQTRGALRASPFNITHNNFLTFDISRSGDRSIKLEGPDDLPLRNKFYSSAAFCFGRRGQGKSLGMTCLAEFQRRRYARARNGYRVAANIWMDPASIVNPKMVEDLCLFPDWGRKLYICLDEVGALISNRRSMAATNVSFGAFLTQIRKRRNEIIFTTQFPQWTDLQILYQIDFFLLMESHNSGRTIKIYVFDWWGQITGNFRRKRWPPEMSEVDWELTIVGADSMWHSYNSDAITAPIWAKNKDQIIMTEHGQDALDSYDVGYEAEEIAQWGAEAPAEDFEQYLEQRQRFEGPGFPVSSVVAALKRFGIDMNTPGAADYVETEMGYIVDRTGPPTIMGKK